jgi:hypothetical protein
MTGSAYVIEYDGAFAFPVSLAELWTTMGRFDCFTSWWGWLSEFSVEGRGLEPGTVLRGVVAPPVPYRMRLEVLVDDCVPEERISAHVHGDLEGAAQLSFDGDDVESRPEARDDAASDAARLQDRRNSGGATTAQSSRPSRFRRHLRHEADR